MDPDYENKLDIAIQYVTRIAEGKNPVNNKFVEDDAVLNNPNVTRCMYFVKDILEDVKNKDLLAVKRKTSRLNYPLENALNYKDLSDKPISIIAKQLNEGLDKKKYKGISASSIRSWLIENEFLFETDSPKYKKKITIPTQKGRDCGMRFEERTRDSGVNYVIVIYNKDAQAMILKNLEQILHLNAK